MSASLPAFGHYANATLVAQLATTPVPGSTPNGWIEDAATGNWIPNPAASGATPSPVYEVIYKCHLHVSRNPQIEKAAGVNITSFNLEGMLLDPWQFDQQIVPNQLFSANFNGLEGWFELLPEQTTLPEFRQFLGTRICGIFRAAGAGKTP
jgi:hypothetical protein